MDGPAAQGNWSEVEIDKIVHATKIIAGHFPVTTNMTIRNKSDSSLEDYGKIQELNCPNNSE